MSEIDHPDLVAREYADRHRLAGRRLDRTAWLRGEDEPFVGIYNARDHMSELWAVLGDPWEDPFGCAYGPAELARHFTRVERRDARTEASWETREALQAHLDALQELAGRLHAPERPYPFRATRHNCILVADKE